MSNPYDELSAHYYADQEARGIRTPKIRPPTALQDALMKAHGFKSPETLARETARAHMVEILKCNISASINDLIVNAMAELEGLA